MSKVYKISFTQFSTSLTLKTTRIKLCNLSTNIDKYILYNNDL